MLTRCSGSPPYLPPTRDFLDGRFISPSAGGLVPAISLCPPLDGRTSLASSTRKGRCNLIHRDFSRGLLFFFLRQGITTLFRKLADREDGRLKSPKNHLSRGLLWEQVSRRHLYGAYYSPSAFLRLSQSPSTVISTNKCWAPFLSLALWD